MENRGNANAQEARYLRKHYKEGGFDEEEEQEDKNFKEDIEKAVRAHSKKVTTKDLEKQIQYYGYKIQPFNMKEQEGMGQIDEDGFFVFSKKRQLKDAWLQSLNQNQDEGAVDKLKKKIKQENRYQNVYQADKKYNDDYKSDEQDEPQQKQQQNNKKEEQVEIKNEGGLTPPEIKMLLAQLLPFNTNVNKYSKQLKKDKETELYDKIIYLCNEYIAATDDYDIFTLKKEELEEEEENQVEESPPLVDWNDDEESQGKK